VQWGLDVCNVGVLVSVASTLLCHGLIGEPAAVRARGVPLHLAQRIAVALVIQRDILTLHYGGQT
jgi:hypothetical protein